MTSFAEITTLGVGGPIAEFLDVSEEAELVSILTEQHHGPALLAGGGSNLVCADEPFDGRVVRVRTSGLSIEPLGDDGVELEVAAGEPWEVLAERAVAEGWSGIEALSGIPGLVGAAPVQNIGAYGQEIGQVVTSIRALDRAAGRVVVLDHGACKFTYRSSVFKELPNRYAVLSVSLRLRIGRESVIRYDELASALGAAVGERADISAVRDAVLALRRAKGMLLDPSDPDSRSVGSFFVNPVVPAGASAPEGCPRYPAEGGATKLSAAWLIEAAGIARGWSLGPDARARVSTKHTLAIVNARGATCEDVIELADAIAARVRDAFSIELTPEPTLIGCSLRARSGY